MKQLALNEEICINNSNIKLKDISNSHIFATTLYESSSGTNSNFELNDSIENYKFLEFYFKTNENWHSYCKVFVNNQDTIKVDLIGAHTVTDAVVWTKYTCLSIKNKTVSFVGYIEMGLNGSTVTKVNASQNYITMVLGYK